MKTLLSIFAICLVAALFISIILLIISIFKNGFKLKGARNAIER